MMPSVTYLSDSPKTRGFPGIRDNMDTLMSFSTTRTGSASTSDGVGESASKRVLIKALWESRKALWISPVDEPTAMFLAVAGLMANANADGEVKCEIGGVGGGGSGDVGSDDGFSTQNEHESVGFEQSVSI